MKRLMLDRMLSHYRTLSHSRVDNLLPGRGAATPGGEPAFLPASYRPAKTSPPGGRLAGKIAGPTVCLMIMFATTLYAQRTTMFPPVRGTHEMVGAANNF